MSTDTQASRIVDKFGGPGRLANLMKFHGRPRNRVNIYRWNYPRSKGGTNGLIPTSALDDILYVARREGIYLSDDDLKPRT